MLHRVANQEARMNSERAAERDFVVRTAQENDVKFIRLWFTDILGNLKGSDRKSVV